MLSGDIGMSNRKAEQSAKKAIVAVAKKNRVSAEEVKREIDLAIAAARKNPDPNIQAFWNSIPCKGRFPTSEEVIAYIAEIGRGITN